MRTPSRSESAAVFPLHARWLPLGDAIARARKGHALSVFEVAERAQMSVDDVRSFELAVSPGDDPSSSYSGPSDEELRRLSQAIDGGASAEPWIEMANEIRGLQSKA